MSRSGGSSKLSSRDAEIEQSMQNPEMVARREEMMRAKSMEPFALSELEQMFWHLRDYSYYVGVRGDYDEAVEIEKLVEYIQQEIAIRRRETVDTVSPELFKEEVRRKEESWINELAAYDDETIRRQNQFEQRFQSQIEQFDVEWENHRLRQYQKQSPKLRDMCATERRLANGGHFEEANEFRKEVDAQRKKEHTEVQRIANHEYGENRVRLIAKQQLELRNMLDTRLHRREALILKQKKEMETVGNRSRLIRERVVKTPASGKVFVAENVSNLRPLISSNRKTDKPELLPKVASPWMNRGDVGHEGQPEVKAFAKCEPKVLTAAQDIESTENWNGAMSMSAIKDMHKKPVKYDGSDWDGKKEVKVEQKREGENNGSPVIAGKDEMKSGSPKAMNDENVDDIATPVIRNRAMDVSGSDEAGDEVTPVKRKKRRRRPKDQGIEVEGERDHQTQKQDVDRKEIQPQHDRDVEGECERPLRRAAEQEPTSEQARRTPMSATDKRISAVKPMTSPNAKNGGQKAASLSIQTMKPDGDVVMENVRKANKMLFRGEIVEKKRPERRKVYMRLQGVQTDEYTPHPDRLEKPVLNKDKIDVKGVSFDSWSLRDAIYTRAMAKRVDSETQNSFVSKRSRMSDTHSNASGGVRSAGFRLFKSTDNESVEIERQATRCDAVTETENSDGSYDSEGSESEMHVAVVSQGLSGSLLKTRLRKKCIHGPSIEMSSGNIIYNSMADRPETCEIAVGTRQALYNSAVTEFHVPIVTGEQEDGDEGTPPEPKSRAATVPKSQNTTERGSRSTTHGRSRTETGCKARAVPVIPALHITEAMRSRECSAAKQKYDPEPEHDYEPVVHHRTTDHRRTTASRAHQGARSPLASTTNWHTHKSFSPAGAQTRGQSKLNTDPIVINRDLRMNTVTVTPTNQYSQPQTISSGPNFIKH